MSSDRINIVLISPFETDCVLMLGHFFERISNEPTFAATYGLQMVPNVASSFLVALDSLSKNLEPTQFCGETFELLYNRRQHLAFHIGKAPEEAARPLYIRVVQKTARDATPDIFESLIKRIQWDYGVSFPMAVDAACFVVFGRRGTDLITACGAEEWRFGEERQSGGDNTKLIALVREVCAKWKTEYDEHLELLDQKRSDMTVFSRGQTGVRPMDKIERVLETNPRSSSPIVVSRVFLKKNGRKISTHFKYDGGEFSRLLAELTAIAKKRFKPIYGDVSLLDRLRSHLYVVCRLTPILLLVYAIPDSLIGPVSDWLTHGIPELSASLGSTSMVANCVSRITIGLAALHLVAPFVAVPFSIWRPFRLPFTWHWTSRLCPISGAPIFLVRREELKRKAEAVRSLLDRIGGACLVQYEDRRRKPGTLVNARPVVSRMPPTALGRASWSRELAGVICLLIQCVVHAAVFATIYARLVQYVD
ncbi:MAG: hypothetical protein AAF483_29850 [Planctomycetota bacterium]